MIALPFLGGLLLFGSPILAICFVLLYLTEN
jgi:hypothetical protein